MQTSGQGSALVLIVDDDRVCAESLADLIREAGHRVRAINDPRGAVPLVESLRPDVIVVDAVMPHLDGITLCVQLRERTGAAILLLNARDDPHDRTIALRVGADDCMAKPFDPSEMEARVSALVRRRMRAPRVAARCIGTLVLDKRGIQATSRGRSLDLTPTEFRLLDLLTARPGRVYSREELLQLVFDGRLAGPTRAVDVHVGRLRRKLAAARVEGVQIRARRGFGYAAFRTEAAATAQRPALLPTLAGAA